MLVGTPIGNLGDASERMARALEGAALVAAEDTRRFQALAAHLGIAPAGRVVSSHEHNEASRVDDVLGVLRAGGDVAVVTDAGMPAVSDPGYRLVAATAEAGLPVTAVPGPSAVLVALALSGLPTDRFCFDGFVPRKPGERGRFFAELTHERRTAVVFESPHRIHATLESAAQELGEDRPAALTRELTKTYEEVVRGTLGEVRRAVADRELKGEITLVIGGALPPAPADPDDHAARVVALARDGMKLKDAAALVASETGLRKRELYEAALRASKD